MISNRTKSKIESVALTEPLHGLLSLATYLLHHNTSEEEIIIECLEVTKKVITSVKFVIEDDSPEGNFTHYEDEDNTDDFKDSNSRLVLSYSWRAVKGSW